MVKEVKLGRDYFNRLIKLKETDNRVRIYVDNGNGEINGIEFTFEQLTNFALNLTLYILSKKEK